MESRKILKRIFLNVSACLARLLEGTIYVCVWRISTRCNAAKRRGFLARAPSITADDRGLSMHIVSDYANARAFVLLGRTPPTGVASLTATLFVRRSFAS